MTPTRNPFTPAFGISPPKIVGRELFVEDFAEALDSGPGSPCRAVLVTGDRGTGKTVTLNLFEEEALKREWVVISETLRKGLVNDLVESTLPRILTGEKPKPNAFLSGVSLPFVGGGVNREKSEAYPSKDTVRTLIFDLAAELDKQERGILISLDEVHLGYEDDLVPIVQVIQHAHRRGLPVAFVAAGLPDAIKDVLNADVLTFLRRAERMTTRYLTTEEAFAALSEPLMRAEVKIERRVLREIAETTGGYPFFVQSVGHELFRSARENQWNLETKDDAVSEAMNKAKERLFRAVHDHETAGLTPNQTSYLLAVRHATTAADIARSLGKKSSTALSVPRAQLIAKGLVRSSGHGRVEYTLPFFREYLESRYDAQVGSKQTR